MNQKGGLTMNNKALSNLVATVLIVLLALAAVAIVWGFLRPTFDRAASTTGLRVACSLVEVEPTGCTYDVNGGSTGGGLATVTYRITSEDDRLSGVLGVWEDSGAETATFEDDTPPADALVSATIELDEYQTEIGDPQYARVAAVVSDNGAEETCDVSLVQVECDEIV